MILSCYLQPISELSLCAIAQSSLNAIAHNPELLQHLATLPNPTCQGNASSWDNIAEVEGWRIQHHPIFRTYRLLNPNGIRKAWWFEERTVLFALHRLLYLESKRH